MKRLITVSLAIMASMIVFGQVQKLEVPAEMKIIPLPGIKISQIDDINTGPGVPDKGITPLPGINTHPVKKPGGPNVPDRLNANGGDPSEWTEVNVGLTIYDLQTNYSSQNRLYLFDDHTIGATWTRGMTTTTFPDRGTGYNYYNGTEWGPQPEARIESMKTGWPSIAAYGTDGEIVCSHSGNDNGLIISYRDTKGTGDWTQFQLIGPAGSEKIEWPRMVTNGPDFTNLHVLALTAPVANSGSLYNGMDGCLLYYRSLNGGVTWDIEHYQFEGMTSSEILAMGGDRYAFAEPMGDTLAFVSGSKWHDFMLYKSTNNGEDWEMTRIWEHPYPLFDFNITVTDTFYTTDDGFAIALDNDGKAHIAFGITRVGHFEIGDTYTSYPFVDGLGYWNEDMPPFESSDPLNTLDPDNLVVDETLIGWTQDVNGNGVWDVIGTVESVGNYRLGISSMPQLTIDENGVMYLVFSSLTETFQTDDQNYRHLWMRVSYDNGATWEPEFHDLTGDIVHIFSECVFPSMAANTDDAIHIIYQMDTEPGGAVQGDEDPYTDNYIPYIRIEKSELGVGIGETAGNRYLDFAGEVFPNPADITATINVHILNSTNLTMSIYSATGQLINSMDLGYKTAGVHTIQTDVSKLPGGVYLYSLQGTGEVITGKMIVE